MRAGLLVLPGIVDIHGDAFERQLQPRPGVDFPAGIALRDTEAQLLANGITTAFHGVTLSWEPGLRSLDAWRALLDALEAERWTCDMRVHLRWEAYNLDALDTALADIAAGRVHLLAFNDHTPSILKQAARPGGGREIQRPRRHEAGCLPRAGGPGRRARRCGVRRRWNGSPPQRARPGCRWPAMTTTRWPCREAFRARGARICEFPMAEEVGRAARAAGDFVVMGSPNVVRGGSHLGWASAAAMAEAGICNVLSSDYYYPAMMRAALVLAERGVLDLAQAWALVSANPAAAARPDRSWCDRNGPACRPGAGRPRQPPGGCHDRRRPAGPSYGGWRGAASLTVDTVSQSG